MTNDNERAPLTPDDLALVRDGNTTPTYPPTAPPSSAGAQQIADDGDDDDAGAATDEAIENFSAETQDDGRDGVVQVERQAPDGRQWSAADKPVVDGFRTVSHQLGLSNHEVSKVTDWFFEANSALAKKRLSADQADRKSLNNAVKRFWGDQAAANRDVVNSFLSSMGGDFVSELKSARVHAAGPLLLNSPNMIEILRLAAIGRRREGGTSRIGEGYSDDRRLAALKGALGKDAKKYFEHGLDRERAALEERAAGRQQHTAPLPGDAQREAQIKKIMRSNFAKYEREGLDKELYAILKRRGAE